MKTYKLLVLLVAGIAFSACAKKKSAESKTVTPPPVVVPDNNNEDNIQETPFILNKNYIGKNLIMVYPNVRNWGMISIHAEDAKALYNVLRVKTILDDEHGDTIPAKLRKGKNIICFEQSSIDTPEVKSYDCNINIDYRLGLIQLQSQLIFSHHNHSTASLDQDYIGDKLYLSKEDGIGRIVIRNEDARALYFTLSSQLRVISEGNRTRIYGAGLSCSEILLPNGNKKAYECLVRLNYRNGEVFFQNNIN